MIRAVLPDVNLDDPKFDARDLDQIIEASQYAQCAKAARGLSKPANDDDALVRPMVEQTGSLDLDDRGHWDFHGHSSGFEFMRTFKAQFGDNFVPVPRLPSKIRRPAPQVLDSPKFATGSPYDGSNLPTVDLPTKEVALELCRNALDDCCALMRPLHRPRFFQRVDDMYDADPDHYSHENIQFLPLLYVVMAVGCLFGRTEHQSSMLDLKGYQEATNQG